jgi:hypothetical protein
VPSFKVLLYLKHSHYDRQPWRLGQPRRGKSGNAQTFTESKSRKQSL